MGGCLLEFNEHLREGDQIRLGLGASQLESCLVVSARASASRLEWDVSLARPLAIALAVAALAAMTGRSAPAIAFAGTTGIGAD